MVFNRHPQCDSGYLDPDFRRGDEECILSSRTGFRIQNSRLPLANDAVQSPASIFVHRLKMRLGANLVVKVIKPIDKCVVKIL